ncbi:hypothetical protein [Kribbella sp. CA-247076]|uniref:hypothetical protein n=1 Tax=Kribbella sp. CA-247076 TaxID=3239941 RepID=UPI003D8E9803
MRWWAAIAVALLALPAMLTGCGADSERQLLTEGARAAREARSEVNTVRLISNQFLDGNLWAPAANRMVTDADEALDQVVSGFEARQPGDATARRRYDEFGEALDAAASAVRDTRIALANGDLTTVRQQVGVLEQAGRELDRLGESAR